MKIVKKFLIEEQNSKNILFYFDNNHNKWNTLYTLMLL